MTSTANIDIPPEVMPYWERFCAALHEDGNPLFYDGDVLNDVVIRAVAICAHEATDSGSSGDQT